MAIKPHDAPAKTVNATAALRKWAPWLVTVGVFWLVFRRVPLIEVVDQMVRVDLWVFVPILIANVIFHYLWDVQVFTLLFRWFGTPVTYRAMAPVRGASYLLMLLNFFVGQGGMALLMNRWKGLSVSRATSVIIFSMFTDYYLLLTILLVSAFRLPGVELISFVTRGDEGDLVRFIVLGWAFFVAHVVFYRVYLPGTQRFSWFQENEVLSSFREGSLFLYFKLILVKSVNSIVGLITCYFVLGAFGLHVPFLPLAAMLPIVWLIGAIPITVMGLGTMQAAMLWLVAQFAEGAGGREEIEAAVVAYSLLWSISYNLGRFAIGAVCVSRLPRRIWSPAQEEPGEGQAD